MAHGVPLGAGQGSVAEFDDRRGLGVIRTEGGGEYPFHCTAMADGTRTIATGAAVSYRVTPGRLGRWEATAIQPR